MNSIIKNNIIKAVHQNKPEVLAKILKDNGNSPKFTTNFVYDYKTNDYIDGSDAFYKFKATPLIYASRKGYDKCVELLLKAGSNPNIVVYCSNEFDVFYENALDLACVYVHPECVRLLLKYGANPNLMPGKDITILQRACIGFDNNKVECVELLLQAGAKINYKTK